MSVMEEYPVCKGGLVSCFNFSGFLLVTTGKETWNLEIAVLKAEG